MGEKRGFNSSAVHDGYHAKKGPVNPPIEESSTYAFESCDDGASRFASKHKKGIYSRLSNPTVSALECKISKLEKGYGGIATASGMAAVNAVYFHFLDKDAHVVVTASMYGTSRTILEMENFYKKWGVRATFLDTSKSEAVERAVNEKTKLIYIETPANPTLSITDIEKISNIAKRNKIQLVVDNTFCSPYLQRPLDFGADVVLHSMTKSIGGHADAVGGIIVAREEKDYYNLRSVVVNTGGVLSPHSAALFFKGVKTLGLRMEKMQENAIKLAQYLQNHEKVEWVIYPGLENHPGNYLIGEDKQMKGPGSMISFGVKNGLEGAKSFLNNLELITLAVSLGGVESLAESPALMTHAGVPRHEREEAGIKDELIRFSAGIENYEDMQEDVKKALRRV
ncbi:MAG TPA: aminotransferase class I/II-fold pyridoxal phosphate-dependent enzyme [Candidatus Nanoarchaeia archaeon]|nr:aminotransferase class I/II-fold pyridoxal phosphate-dependent enzyme [Candidatus Nanoarchaeia archaeon]